MDSGCAIEVENVSKRFFLRSAGSRTLKSAAIDLVRRRGESRRSLWALSDVSFTVPKGETLGIIGANGAGKSTLLSLLAGTKVPTKGRIKTEGSISSLLELGAGFHPDLTGAENVFLSGTIMGLSRMQMKERFDAIVEFAGLREFIDQPVKHYSSGMYVRLGFAVAVEVNPDILLIDEVLAVGDVSFQRKCIESMNAFRKRGKTMLIISHDLATIQSISDRILLLDEGRIMGIGEPSQVVTSYQSISRRKAVHGMEREWGTGEIKITHVEFVDGNGDITDTFKWGQALKARIFYESSERIANPVFGFAIAAQNGQLIYGNNTQIEGFDMPVVEGKGSLTLCIDSLSMATGTYLFSFSVHSADHRVNYHRLDNRFPIAVECEKAFEGCCHMPVKWTSGENGPS